MFMGAGIEEHQRAGTETFDLTDVMFAKPAPLVQSARVCKDMSPTCPIDMQVNRLLADRTLCEKRVNSPPNQQLYEFQNPHMEMLHGWHRQIRLEDAKQHLHRTEIVTKRNVFQFCS
jgi:hypothetical protein